MAEVDTSSYPKPQLPVNTLDVAGKLGGLQSQALGINQQKFDQTNQALGYMTRSMASLGPDASKDQYLAVAQNAVKMGLVPPEMLSTYEQRLRAAPTGRDFYNEFVNAAATHQEALDYHLGRPGSIQNGQTIQPTVTSQKPGFGVRSTGAPIQMQPPPTLPTVDDQGRPNVLGAQPPDIAPGSGAVAAPPPVNNLPVSQSKPAGSALGGLPGFAPGETIMTQKPDVSFNQPVTDKNQSRMVPRGPVTGFAPGVAEGENIAGAGSGTQLAQDRAASTNFQREIFPLTQAIPLLEKLGTKGVGPGTETINHFKSFLLSNVPGLKADDPAFASITEFDKLKKYFVDYANTVSNAGTNDRLAAAFAGNPSVSISQAASIDVAKSVLALRRMKQAQLMEFEQKNLPAAQYSKWVAQRTNELDPRAFGVDMMTDDAKAKLKARLDKNPKEKRQFEQSLELAHSLGFLTPAH